MNPESNGQGAGGAPVAGTEFSTPYQSGGGDAPNSTYGRRLRGATRTVAVRCVAKVGGTSMRIRTLSAIAATVVASTILGGVATAQSEVAATRISGPTRIETAAAISSRTFPVGVPGLTSAGGTALAPPAADVLLARSDAFPDAMAGNFLANHLKAPILLTDSDALHPVTRGQLAELGAERVTLLGGQAALSPQVARELREAGHEVRRIGGETRQETAQLIAEAVGREDVGTLGTSGRTAIVTRSDDFADALTGGAVAYAGSFAHLLTPPDLLAAAARNGLTNLDIQYAILVGGPDAISAEVERAIQALGIPTQRVAGGDRTETAVRLAEFGRTQLGHALDQVTLARGDAFADALTGGTYAGFFGQPILLTRNPETLGQATTRFLADHADLVREITVLGGPAAVSEQAVAAAQSAAGSP